LTLSFAEQQNIKQRWANTLY